MDIARFFILWGPTLLFILIVLVGVLIGCCRGLRKSLILFIQMFVAAIICLIVYLWIVNNPSLDTGVVSFVNGILNTFGSSSLQELFETSSQNESLRQILLEYFTKSMTSQDIQYWLIIDNVQYIGAMVDLAYHLVFALLCYILYFLLIFLFYIIYLIAYPVRRKIKKENQKYQNGEVNHPYRKKRLLGSLIGGIRSIFTGIVCFSFLGSLIFILTGGGSIPQRDQIKEDSSLEFSDPTFNTIYDYYSYVCEMGNTGIFKVLNSVKDTNDTPFYFYFADLVLQGKYSDENLNIENEKFYLRDEIGEYIHFANSSLALLLKYADGSQIESIMANGSNEEKMNVLMTIMSTEGFSKDFSDLIDGFKGKKFMVNVCLSSLTSLINHFDLIDADEKIKGLIYQLFKSEDAIKVTDLATEQDVKTLFKGLISAIAEIGKEEPVTLSAEETEEEEQNEIIPTEKMIKLAQNFIPTIQSLSLFSTRKETGNKIIKGLYTYCSTYLVEEDISFEIPNDIIWVDEFNILLNACNPLLTLAYEIYSPNQEAMLVNLAKIFEKDNAAEMEKAFDSLTEQLVTSKLLDVVFKSSLVGEQLDKIVISIASDNENAKIPKNISYTGKNGECSIFLSSFKHLLKNGGGSILLTMMENKENIDPKLINEMFQILNKEIEVSDKKITLLNKVLESKLLYYMISTYLMYADLGGFKLYLPEESIEIITEGNETYQMIKHQEIDIIADMISNCSELITELIQNQEQINYAKIFVNPYINETLHKSLLLQGTLANVIIEMSNNQEGIILPFDYDIPESWLSSLNKKGEIEILIDVISRVSEIKVDEEKYLINEILNGSISPKVLLDLNDATLHDLCDSKILRYTISDMITSLGQENFKITVAYSSIEELNASTTSGKTVNVVSANELYNIFVNIKKIIYFEGDVVKIDYNGIFENKEQITDSKTITATIIQMIFDYDTSSFLVIPEDYKQDFKKIISQPDLTGNVWFKDPSTSTDDELYLMLSAIETFIDKDENGKIPNTFDFETLQNELKLRKNDMDKIYSSTILNASISKQIIDIFYVPEAMYKNDIIDRQQLDHLFDAIFEMFRKDEIIVKELDDDLFDLQFTRDSISVILNSEILRATISSKMDTIEVIAIPNISYEVKSFIHKEQGPIIYQEELQCIFNAMFSIFGTDLIKVNNLEEQLTGLGLRIDSIDLIKQSIILRATISKKLAESNDIIIMEKDTENYEMLDQSTVYVIKEKDLSDLLLAMFTFLDKDTIIVDHIETHFTDLSFDKNDIPVLMGSSILQSTLSKKIVDVPELSIPLDVVQRQTSINQVEETIVDTSELTSLLTAMFILLDTDSIYVKHLDSNLQNFTLDETKVDGLIESQILQTTVSSNFIDVPDLTIPTIVLETILDKESAWVSRISKEELRSFFHALFTTTPTISGKGFVLNELIMPVKIEEARKMMDSIIISATLSEKILIDISMIVILDELITPYMYKGAVSLDSYIEQNELANLLISLTVGLGKLDPNNLNLEEVSVPKSEDAKTALVGSMILRATISKEVLNQASVSLSLDNSCLNTSYHNQSVSVGILEATEILSIIRGIELLNPTNGKFNDLVLDVGDILRMDNSEVVLDAIVSSNVYLSIISHTLGEEKQISIGSLGQVTCQAYQLFTSATPTTTIEVDGAPQEYQYRLEVLPLQGTAGYVIQYPKTSQNVYSSFTLEIGNAYLCQKEDILALKQTVSMAN